MRDNFNLASIVTLILTAVIVYFTVSANPNKEEKQHKELIGHFKELRDSVENVTKVLNQGDTETKKLFEEMINVTSSLKEKKPELSLELSYITNYKKSEIEDLCNHSFYDCYISKELAPSFTDTTYNIAKIKIKNMDNTLQKTPRLFLNCGGITFFKIMIYMPAKVKKFDSFFGKKTEFKFTDLSPNEELVLDMSFLREEEKAICVIKYNSDESESYEEIWEFTDNFKKIFPY